MERDIFSKIKELKTEISNIRTKINDLKIKKNDLYNKKEELYQNIVSNIQILKKLKGDIDTYKSKKEEIKNKRDSKNKKFKDLITEIKDLRKEKENLSKKNNIYTTPLRLKEQIDKLEQKIETEALSFDTEKKIMAKIKDLKRKHDATLKLSNIKGALSYISDDVNITKKIADEFHNQFIQEIEKNKDNYEKFKQISKRVTDLRREKDSVFSEYKKLKEEIIKLNNNLQEKLIELNKSYSLIGEEKKKKEQLKKEKVEQILLQKTKDIEEKFRIKRKLTTQDLIILQARKDSDSELNSK